MSVRWFVLPILAGCATGSTSLPDPQPFAACAIPPDGGSSSLDASVTLTGAVSDAGTGDDAHCFGADGIGALGEVDEASAWWITAPDDQGADWQFGVWFPDGPAGPAVGDVVTADFAWQFGGFGPTIGHLDLRDDAGALIAWVGEGGEVSDLPSPPGLSLSQGAAVARDHDQCGAWASYDLDANGVDVAYGAVAQVDGLEVRHGGIDLGDSSSDRCQDWFVAHAAVGVLP